MRINICGYDIREEIGDGGIEAHTGFEPQFADGDDVHQVPGVDAFIGVKEGTRGTANASRLIQRKLRRIIEERQNRANDGVVVGGRSVGLVADAEEVVVVRGVGIGAHDGGEGDAIAVVIVNTVVFVLIGVGVSDLESQRKGAEVRVSTVAVREGGRALEIELLGDILSERSVRQEILRQVEEIGVVERVEFGAEGIRQTNGEVRAVRSRD